MSLRGELVAALLIALERVVDDAWAGAARRRRRLRRRARREDGACRDTVCDNAADVRVANGRHWCRPLCIGCALEFEARAARDGFRVAFVELEAR